MHGNCTGFSMRMTRRIMSETSLWGTPEIQYNFDSGRWTAEMVGTELLKW